MQNMGWLKALAKWSMLDVFVVAILDFNAEATEISLWEACQVYRGMTGESPNPMVAYNIWFKKHHEHLFVLSPVEMERHRNTERFFEGTSKGNTFD